MPGLADIPGVEVHGKGTRDWTLPVGAVDETGKIQDQIILREMKGEEDDMMGNDDLPIGERVSSVLTSCTEKLGDISDKGAIRAAIADEMKVGLPITEQDRIAAMVFLRRTSIGDTYKFERRCPRCGTLAENRSTDLRTLTIEKSKHPERRRVQIKLPHSGHDCIVKVLTAQGAIEIGRLRPTTKELKSLALVSRIESIDGKPIGEPQKALQVVKDLPQADRNFIRQTYNAMEAFVEDDIEVECRNPICLISWTFKLDVGQGFFLDLDSKLPPQDLKWL